MIIDLLSQSNRYTALHPGFTAAFDFLRTAPLDQLTNGRHEIDGDRIFAIIARLAGVGHHAARLEVHRKYIDIQCVISGHDEIGWRPLASCEPPVEAYDSNRDIAFLGDPAESWNRLVPGTFAIYFPADAHAPLAVSEMTHKVVVKILDSAANADD